MKNNKNCLLEIEAEKFDKFLKPDKTYFDKAEDLVRIRANELSRQLSNIYNAKITVDFGTQKIKEKAEYLKRLDLVWENAYPQSWIVNILNKFSKKEV